MRPDPLELSVLETALQAVMLDVVRKVKLRLRTCAPGGGLILSPAHNIQPDVSVENILAMYEAARQRGRV